MTGSILRQAIVISLLGHITLFSMFSLSFGPKIPEVNFSRIYFWGAVFRGCDLMNIHNLDIGYKTGRLSGKPEISALDNIKRENLLASRDYLRPLVSLAFNQEKIAFQQEFKPTPPVSGKRESAIMFYPSLPYQFALYFKDRQTVHIELAFAVISGDKRDSVLVKRRISSGNLEADLLSMRYISRYLFMQEKGFTPNKWQIVKIDLSTAND